METEKNVRMRRDGRYEARYVKTRDENGKAIYASCYGRTREEAIAKREQATKELFINQNRAEGINLLILGAGSHGQEVYEIASQLRVFGRIDFLDDSEARSNAIGPWSMIDELHGEYTAAIVAVGDETVRKMWFAKITEAGYVVPSLVHPSAIVLPRAVLEPGCVICARAAISPGARIGQGSIISAGVAVARDEVVDDWTHIEVGGIVGW